MAAMTVQSLFFQLKRLLDEGKIKTDMPVRVWVPTQGGYGTTHEADHLVSHGLGEVTIFVNSRNESGEDDHLLEFYGTDALAAEMREHLKKLMDEGAVFDEATGTYVKDGKHYDTEGKML